MMQEMYAAYETARAANMAECERLERLIARHKAKLKKLNDKRPGWYDAILTPLADAISADIGMPYEVYGPFGLSCETSLYFFPTSGRDITRNETYSITLYPDYDDSRLYLSYDTGERTDTYRTGSIGWMNGMNNVTKPLPDDLETIIVLLQHNKAKEEA